MRFKKFYTEGRDAWNNFTLRKTNKRWSFMNTESGKRYFIKLGDNVNHVGGIQSFLEDLGATDSTTPKTQGNINYSDLAMRIVKGEKSNIHVKSGSFDKIKSTWLLDI